ncbi:MAG TPA: Bax inhibitor-1/YccA family protein, partial [Amnibacterium sp.]|nr:Bax inhibitor-1/YccA family protein [Amnibacterium sp.]
SPFGLSSSVTIAGIPLGVLVGIFAVLLAAYSLVLDFDQIQQGVRRGLPAKYAWTGAFGLMVTIVWLYVEFLRIFAILNRR